MCLLVHYVGAGSNPAEPNLFFLHALATATQRRRPRFQRTAFHPETRPDRADTSVSVRGGVSVFSRNALLLRTTIFLFRSRVRARRRGGVEGSGFALEVALEVTPVSSPESSTTTRYATVPTSSHSCDAPLRLATRTATIPGARAGAAHVALALAAPPPSSSVSSTALGHCTCHIRGEVRAPCPWPGNGHRGTGGGQAECRAPVLTLKCVLKHLR